MARKASERTPSAAQRVFLKIEEAILDGSLAPGEVLTENRLCEWLAVSRTPVREALNRLRQEGLMEETSKGDVVLGVTEQDLADIYEVRLRIEGLATALCAEVITPEQLASLEETVALQEFYTGRGQVDSIKNLDSRFHRQIYEFCGSKVLSDILTDLHRKVQRFRRASVENADRALAAVGEHRQILEALRQKNRSMAERLAVAHIRNARTSIAKTNQGTD